jgi:hypothetical protein
MNQRPNQFGLDSLRLTKSERAEMRANLISHMEANPLPVLSPYLVFSPFTRHAFKPFAYTFALLLIVGAGTSVAASDALPGSMLYAVKVNVNERVQTAFARTPEEKASLAVELTHKRLDEVELLAASSTLSRTQEDAAGERIADAALKAVQAIASLEREDSGAAKKINATLTATLVRHTSILETLAASGNESANAVFEESRNRAAPKEEVAEPTATTTEDRPQSKTNSNKGAAAAAAANN